MKIVLSILVLLATDNWVGTWVLDPAHSTYSPGPTPKSVTLKYEFVEGGVKVTNDTIAADGTQVVRSTTIRFDGADYPYSNNINADTASGKRINDYSFETQWKKNGKPTLSQRISVGGDLKTLTVTQTGQDYQGRTVHNVGVYSKQR